MSVCTRCGHELGVGRFCLNCGHPVGAPATPPTPVDDDWRTDTAERRAVPATAEHRHVGPRQARRSPWLLWLVAGAVLLLLAGGGAWLLLGGGDEPSASRGPTARAPESTPAETAAPDAPTEEPPEEPPEAQDVARRATVAVPATASPTQDVDGNLVRYEGRNMLDGVPETCWRMPGDGSGESLVLELDGPTTLTTVGLVNGYAKTAVAGGTTYDWYTGNRRVLVVEWVFDDGTVVRQGLDSTRDLQTVEIDAVTTQSVELRLVSVSPPGEGSAARDFTALSEVSLVGSPG